MNSIIGCPRQSGHPEDPIQTSNVYIYIHKHTYTLYVHTETYIGQLGSKGEVTRRKIGRSWRIKRERGKGCILIKLYK